MSVVLLLIPGAASSIVIYPREHYLFSVYVLLVVLMAVLLRRADGEPPGVKSGVMVLLALAVTALTPYAYGQETSYRSNLEVVRFIEDMDCYSNVILGARVDPNFSEGKCRVMAIMTGVQSPNLLSSRPERKPNPLAPTVPNRKIMTNPKVGNIDFVR